MGSLHLKHYWLCIESQLSLRHGGVSSHRLMDFVGSMLSLRSDFHVRGIEMAPSPSPSLCACAVACSLSSPHSSHLFGAWRTALCNWHFNGFHFREISG